MWTIGSKTAATILPTCRLTSSIMTWTLLIRLGRRRLSCPILTLTLSSFLSPSRMSTANPSPPRLLMVPDFRTIRRRLLVALTLDSLTHF